MVKNPPAMPETQKIRVQFLGQEDPLGEEMTTHCSILAWRTMDKGTWWATVHGVAELNSTEHTTTVKIISIQLHVGTKIALCCP